MRLLEEASEEIDYEGYIPEGNGPYGTVLHTASAIGNHWIVEMQIKAGVDVTALDDHGWTAFMVAEAQGHTACARLLFEHMEDIGLNLEADAFAPSGIVKSEPSSPIEIESDDLMAMPGSWHYSLIRKRVQVRANHPIPPSSPTFYFEVTILNNGPLGYVKLLVISSLVTEKETVLSASVYVDQKQMSLVCQVGIRVPGVTTEMMVSSSTVYQLKD